jgi:hypothetical protein
MVTGAAACSPILAMSGGSASTLAASGEDIS